MSDDRTTVELHGQLHWFADSRRRSVPVRSRRSVKDLIESLGVPHPEIDLVTVDGEVVGLDHVVHGGEHVTAHPPVVGLASPLRPPPPSPPRFVADVHLGTLARRLLVLGLDVEDAAGRDDPELAATAVRERRILLTRDRGLLMRRIVVHGYCPRSDDPDDQVLEVVARFVSPHDLAPFTRCPACNRELARVAPSEVGDRIGPHTRATHDDFRECPDCDRVFWPGSHTEALAPLVAAALATARVHR